MRTFFEFLSDLDLLSRLWLLETYFSFDAEPIQPAFRRRIGKTVGIVPGTPRGHGKDAWVQLGRVHRQESLRNAGYRDQREVQERTHDIVVKLLTGGLFRNYDETKHGPLDLRFKRAVANAIKNMVEKHRNPAKASAHRSHRPGIQAGRRDSRRSAGSCGGRPGRRSGDRRLPATCAESPWGIGIGSAGRRLGGAGDEMPGRTGRPWVLLADSLSSGSCRKSNPWPANMPSGLATQHLCERSTGRWNARRPLLRSDSARRRRGMGGNDCHAFLAGKSSASNTGHPLYLCGRHDDPGGRGGHLRPSS